MSGVQRVRIAAKRNSAHTEIYQLGQGVGTFKQKFAVDYIPSKIVLRERMDYNFSDPLELASHNWLRDAWPKLPPQLATNTSPYPMGTVPITNGIDWNSDGVISQGPITLEGDQCLVFFLGGINEGGQPSGFSLNKSNPMDPSTKERLGPFFQFPTDRLIPRSGTAAGTAGFRSFIDPWKTQPYMYFTSYGKQKGYLATETALGVAPYIDPATGKGKMMDGFQIICAGEDKVFGQGGTNLPATGPGEDDIANFSQGTLGSGGN